MNGGDSIGNAQFDLGGSIPAVCLASKRYGSNSLESVAALNSVTVASSAAASRPSFAASSPIVAALTGSWSVKTTSLKPLTDRLVWSQIRNADWSWLRQI